MVAQTAHHLACIIFFIQHLHAHAGLKTNWRTMNKERKIDYRSIKGHDQIFGEIHPDFVATGFVQFVAFVCIRDFITNYTNKRMSRILKSVKSLDY
ncbi:MAG: hypothetical protein BA869_11345 [Desulfuromonadales bacterium C00003107]|nr:MAG: hypothetical protein BA869_11345 [Desulfuromonadales bacterium C00003107]